MDAARATKLQRSRAKAKHPSLTIWKTYGYRYAGRAPRQQQKLATLEEWMSEELDCVSLTQIALNNVSSLLSSGLDCYATR